MTREMSMIPLAVAVLLASLAAAGCSDDGDDPRDTSEPRSESPSGSPRATASGSALAIDDLDGTTYVSRNVEGRELVDGTEVQLSFQDGVMAVSAGCNTVFGDFAVDASGVLRWTGEPGSTLVDCPADRETQDRWLTSLLTDGAAVTSQGNVLALSAGDVTVELTAEPPADLDPVLGRTWTLIGTIADGATSRLPRHANRPFLSVRPDGVARLDTGCNVGRTTVRVDGDQLVFGHATTTRRACRGPARLIEEALLAIVDQQRTDHVEVRDALLILSRAQHGLVFDLNRQPTTD